MDLKSLIRNIPDFPQPGILYRDITTLLRDKQGLRYVIDVLTEKCQLLESKPEYIIGIESRGFIVELKGLQGRKKLSDVPMLTLVEYS